mgnify:CR=1 FL=1
MSSPSAYDSVRRHPLGARDSWPIYGFVEADEAPHPPRTLWGRLVTAANPAPSGQSDAASALPVWY